MKLSNNGIASVADWHATLAQVIDDPSAVSWVDLSFNKLTTVDPVLTALPLTTLYLHANAIGKLSDVEKLKSLTKLRSLTLHGNPVEEHKHYRPYIIALLPNLRTLDFTAITPADRRGAEGFKRSMEARKKRQRDEYR